MQWEQLLSLKRQGDLSKRLRIEQDNTRLGFEVDYDRILFSSAFRSLQDKTQVIPLSNTDFVHTRLTHSLEVSVVGRSLGRMVGGQVLEKHSELSATHGYQATDFGAIVAAAALAHDIGNPPFGHSGEKAIGAFFTSGLGAAYAADLSEVQRQELVDFEGNANGFRLLNASREGVPGGLRLSYATLGAFTKYPKEALPKKPSQHIADKKYGFFQSQKALYSDLATVLGLPSRGGAGMSFARHPLAFLVEAADDICYTIIDFEDGINLGLISEDYALEYLIKLVKDSINSKTYHAMVHMEDRLSYLRALAINTLITDAAKVFMAYEAEILAGTFDCALLEKSQYKAQIEDIISLSVQKVYQAAEVLEKEVAGYKIIADLLGVVATAFINQAQENLTAYDRLILKLVPAIHQPPNLDTYSLLLASATYVASLSDRAAVHLHNKISGKML
ncbi:MAG: dNTP triphosphohydrolase [Flavobacteriaceae bacterium]|tara:strand:+ start:2464 stop:3804 length:1341 start_codon:yes stop_codon:yes gene_type:complete